MGFEDSPRGRGAAEETRDTSSPGTPLLASLVLSSCRDGPSALHQDWARAPTRVSKRAAGQTY